MIIMDRMSEYRPLSIFSALDKARLSSWLKPKLSGLVHSFHEQDLVHGDLRDANVLVWEDGEEVKLIDFDWGGNAGEVRYPSAINCTDFWRPRGVTDGVIITKEHDTQMIEKMFP
jgi:serine/threonine protein kinase